MARPNRAERRKPLREAYRAAHPEASAMPEEPTGPVSAAIPPGSSEPGSGAQAPLAGATPSEAGGSGNNRPAFIFLCLGLAGRLDRKSTRLNSSHLGISYAVFCLK